MVVRNYSFLVPIEMMLSANQQGVSCFQQTAKNTSGIETIHNTSAKEVNQQQHSEQAVEHDQLTGLN